MVGICSHHQEDGQDHLDPISLFSIVFLVMTLAAYAFEKSLRDHLHGKMTVVFLCNLTICFFVAALSWFEVAPALILAQESF